MRRGGLLLSDRDRRRLCPGRDGVLLLDRESRAPNRGPGDLDVDLDRLAGDREYDRDERRSLSVSPPNLAFLRRAFIFSQKARDQP